MPIAKNYNQWGIGAKAGKWNPDGSFVYPDGSVATADEIKDARAKAGLPPLSAMRQGGKPSTAAVMPGGSMDPMISQSTGEYGEATAPVIDESSPGTTLDTTAADAERERMAPLLSQLQQQAATGGGAWEGTLKDATDKASASTMALGQSLPGQSYKSSLRNIGNAQAGVQQRAAGQEAVLRDQSKEDATNQLGSLLAGQGAQDISQAAGQSDVRFGARTANEGIRQQNQDSLINKRQENEKNAVTAVKFVGGAMMSDGGKVPGTPKVFGDDSVNDTVPAKLSPGEIVIPRSHATSPEAAADFVRALHAKGYADGGSIQGGYQDPGIKNGAMLDTTQINQNRSNMNGVMQSMEARANAGPSPGVTQGVQNATDSNIAAAMSRPGSLNAFGAAAQGAAYSAAGQSAEDQQRARIGLAKTSLGQRDRESALGQAQQGAAWRNTLMNTGISLSDMAMMRDLQSKSNARAMAVASGAGQGLAAYSAAAGGKDQMDYSGSDKNTPSFDAGGSSPDEWDSYPSQSSGDLHGFDDEKWAGGMISKPKKYAGGGQIQDTRATDFVAALRRGR